MNNIQAKSSASTFRLETSVEAHIAAPATKIMSLLTDAKNFPQWNSTVVDIEGEITKGATIKLRSKLDPKRTFKLKVEDLTPTSMIWKDGVAPMFSGVRNFTLTTLGDGTTHFSMVEVFKGLMLPLIKSSLPDFKANFEQYAQDLKRASEKN